MRLAAVCPAACSSSTATPWLQYALGWPCSLAALSLSCPQSAACAPVDVVCATAAACAPVTTLYTTAAGSSSLHTGQHMFVSSLGPPRRDGAG
jgi:hypothetical protein